MLDVVPVLPSPKFQLYELNPVVAEKLTQIDVQPTVGVAEILSVGFV